MRDSRNRSSVEEYLSGLGRLGIKPGLERISRMLEESGNPQKSLFFIHVAGTNGKGSVCAMVESALRASGYRTGLYTSPHLISWRERIRISGVGAARETVEECAAGLIPVAEKVAAGPEGRPTYFEFMTALSFLCFLKEKVDFAVVETGLGGRLDATNVISAPCAAITTIGLEHREFLGGTLEAVAGEKSAIITEGAYVVCGEMDGEAAGVVARRCGEKRATMRRIGDDIIYRILSQGPGGMRVHVDGVSTCVGHVFLSLAGRYQAANCAVALGLLDGLTGRGANLAPDSIRKGLAAAAWPGRMQLLRREPPFIVDCAHNPQAAEALAGSVTELFPGRKWILILGVLRDKDVGAICEHLLPMASVVIATRVESERAAEPAAVERACGRGAMVVVTGGLCEALPLALELCGEGDGVLLTGSTYLVGEALAMWESGGIEKR